MKRIYLYGIAGADRNYRIIRYDILNQDVISIRNIIYYSMRMRIKYPTIEHIYAIDSRKGLGGDYLEAIRKNSIESYAVFKDILEREGLLIV